MLNAKLLVVGGDAKSGEFDLRLPSTIGRGREATLTLPHPLVSRLHCEIFERDGKLIVKDLKSLNGTFVNNQKIVGEEAIEPDQLLTLGNVTFRAVYEIGVEVTPAADTIPAPLPSADNDKTEFQTIREPVETLPASGSNKETVYEERGKSDTDSNLPCVGDLGEIPDAKTAEPADVSDNLNVSASNVPAELSFSGGIQVDAQPEIPANMDTAQLDIPDTDQKKDAEDPALGSFIRKLPR